MELILDVTRVTRRVAKNQTLTGIDRVTMAYVHHYANQAHALVRWYGHSWILSQQQSQKLFQWLLTPSTCMILRKIILTGILQHKKFNPNKKIFLLNTGHIGSKHATYERLARHKKVKPIFFVHDLIPMHYPEYCSSGEDKRHKAKMDYLLALGHGVITNSQATLNDLHEYCQQTDKKLPPAVAALLGSSLCAPLISGSRPTQNPYFVMLSTIEPRKNHLLLLKIWRQLVQTLGKQTPQLYIIGKRGWECENVMDLLDRSKFLADAVTEVPTCSDTELITYLSHAQALLFPSFTEGYGLPVLEALSLGIPVIASNLPVFREIAAEVPEYIEPLDEGQWKQTILEYAQSNSLRREAQMMRMQNIHLPNWEHHFNQVDVFLKRLSR
ncbi:MAG: glycosyltransferase family 1 protein [Legionella sp.]|uniref:glycosyltransferase family 4 protein n=1 Tax=Legionella sp. TaxID=459 RepID=UPI0039E56EEB